MKTKTIMNQIALAGACALPLASAGAGNSLEIKMKKKPNIILINCDDLGYGDLGCYGSQRNHTPTIDALAAEGTRFTDFYMPASVCSPSRAGMYTGCYPARIGFDTFDGLNAHNKPVLCPGDPTGLNPSEITFAEILKEQGYATKLVGKWHCGDQPEFLPTQHGFDSYFGLPFSNSDARSKWKPTGQPLPLMRDTDVIEQQPQQADLTARYVEECSQFIEANQNEPFLLCLAHMYVHTPLYVPDEFMKNSENGKYGGAVAAIDWALSVMLRQLKELGIEENTLILFTSDNGSYLQSPITDVTGGSNDPLRGWKGCTWEGGIRLPLIARWPGKIPAGRECSELITAMDFLPTFAALADGTVPTDRTIDGHDITDILLDRPNAASPYEAYCYYLKDKMTSIRSGKWKLWFQEKELYNLEEDIAETVNLYADHPHIVEKLDRLADRYRQELGDSLQGIQGNQRRPVGHVENPKPLTEYHPDHPYTVSLYD